MKISLNSFYRVFAVSRQTLLKFCCTLLCLSALFASGCMPDPQRRPGRPLAPYFRPPAASTSLPAPGVRPPASAPLGAGAAAQAPDDAECRDSLAFLKDLTIPDGTLIAPESTLDKRWEVANPSNCNWDEGYRVRLIAGPDLGAQQEQALYPARSGTQAVIRIVFKAPAEPGAYRSAWQAFNARGEPFGDPFFMDIVVAAPE